MRRDRGADEYRKVETHVNVPAPGVHPLAAASLGFSLLAYGSSFIGSSPALLYPALATAAVAVLCGHLARRAVRREPHRHGGTAIALAGIVSGYAYLVLGTGLLLLIERAAAGG